MKCVKVLKYLQWMSIEGHENREKLLSTNHVGVHKSEVDSPPDSTQTCTQYPSNTFNI